MAKEVSSAEKPPSKHPHPIWDKRKSLILLGLSVIGILVLVWLWWVQQTNVIALQKRIESLEEIQKSGRLTPQQSWELQKDIAGLEKDRITLSNNVYGTLVQAAGGAALLIGLYFTWRNQKIAEETAANNFKSAQETLRLSQEGQVTERFTRAIEQLGSEKQQTRLGGIYALERIAKDSPKDHWTIMEVLTSFVQEKSPVQENKNNQEVEPKTEEKKFQKITKDVQAALTVIGRRDFSKDPEYVSLDLSRANLRDANLFRADLSDAYLVEANLFRADLVEANLSDANLFRANLSDAYLFMADLSQAHLTGANLRDAYLTRANLQGAQGLTPEQVRSAQNWQEAKYDSDFRKELGLPSESAIEEEDN